VEFIGRKGFEVLFVANDKAVLIDERSNLVTAVDTPAVLLASFTPEGDQTKPSSAPFELAISSTTDLDIKVFSNNDRMYTIPSSVQAEAKRGLAWHKEEHRGGTSVGLHTARLLAAGGQIGIRKVRHIAKYFPRHAVDKKGQGYTPGEKNYPSNGRIAWALWGGDAGERWASAIVERENKKQQSNSITASFDYVMSNYESPEEADLSSFTEAELLPEDIAPQFYVRVRLDGSGVDRLYKVNSDGSVFVWDDAMWEDLGNINHDFETYDKSLDDASDNIEKTYIPIDIQTAITISGLIDAKPFTCIPMSDVHPEETELISNAMGEIDWQMIDDISFDDNEPIYEKFQDFSEDAITADGAEAAPAPAPAGQATPATTGPIAKGDGQYTPAERSQNASSQVRDATGKFAKAGSTVSVAGKPEYTGKIMSMNPAEKSVKIQLANGATVDVPGNLTQDVNTIKSNPQQQSPYTNLNLTKGILGEPRTPIDQAKGNLVPGSQAPLTIQQTRAVISDYASYAKDQQSSSNLATSTPTPAQGNTPATDKPQMTPGVTVPIDKFGNPTAPLNIPNAYNDPQLRDFLNKKVINPLTGETTYPNAVWYRPDLRGVSNIAIDKYNPKLPSIKESLSKPILPQYAQKPKGLTSAGTSDNVKIDTPYNSNVPPIYMAVVSQDDPQAVMDLIALAPISTGSTEMQTFKRQAGKWVADASYLNDLNSPTPPPVVVLDNATLANVIEQVDGSTQGKTASANPDFSLMLPWKTTTDIAAIVAAVEGGLDRNKGNAEKLRRYWLEGRGAAKIRWNTGGDWTRCVRHLSKYLGPRAKGYCALRHHEATGLWTGDKKHMQMYGRKSKGKSRRFFSNDFVVPKEAVLIASMNKLGLPESPIEVADDAPQGSKFHIPLVIPEGVETGDGRKFAKGAILMRELPLPLLWQIETGEGHNGSVVIGKIIRMERTENGIGNAVGYFDNGVYGKEAERLVRGGFIRGVSADMDKFEADQETASDIESEGKVGGDKMNITKARVMAVTLVAKPAFQECYLTLEEPAQQQEEQAMLSDGVYVEGMNSLDASALVACGLVAGMIPVTPPAEWFNDPKLTKPTGLTVTDDGKVFGHIAAWHVDHIGMAFGTKPPRSRSKYAYFHTGVVRTDEGNDIPVGQLTLAGGHASLEASASEAVRHYDDTASAVADVHAGEDAYGIWVSGALRPGTTPEQIRALRASAPSGDWRPIKGGLELVAVCQVNVPGFPIARARVASGQVMALVAAGANVLAQLKSDPLAELNHRLDKIERATTEPLLAAANAAKARMATITASIKAAELSSRIKKMKDVDSAYMDQMDDTELAIISHKERMKLADEGKALPDGSFPIRNAQDLKNAIHAYGRTTPGKKGDVRTHIVKMARALDQKDLIPENWTEASTEESVVASLRDRIAIVESIVAAAGGVDRNRGNAETLRRYWVHGKGAAKIRWGQKGDWSRCVRHLAKYLGPRAKGYCQLRHHDALGIYTATHAKMDRAKHASNFSMEENYYSADNGFDTQVTDEDTNKSLDEILGQPDDSFDHNWNPDSDIVILLTDPEVHDASDALEPMTDEDMSGMPEDDSDSMPIDETKKWVSDEQQDVDTVPFLNGEQALVSATTADACPPATGNIGINLANRQKAIDTAAYGPLNPKEPNDEFWQEKATRWSVDISEAKKSLCGNCVMFIRTPKMLDCIASGLESGDSSKENAWDAIDTAELGYCEAFDFKCAASRTCNAWVVGGPITAAGEEQTPVADAPPAPATTPVVTNPEAKITKEDLKGLDKNQLEQLRKGAKSGLDENTLHKLSAEQQPRDTNGKFREVLARLKTDLGPSGSQDAIAKIQQAEDLEHAGNYLASTKASAELLDVLGRLDTKALDPTSLENVRTSAKLLGQVISNLPFDFNNQAEKIRFSDVPPVLQNLMKDMADRVVAKIGQKDGTQATAKLREFFAGGDYFSQSEVSQQMSIMLRLLT
jgi:hypothetical protein